MSIKFLEVFNNNGENELDKLLRRQTQTGIFSFIGNSGLIKIDSPRTKQACIELGIDPSSFTYKFKLIFYLPK